LLVPPIQLFKSDFYGGVSISVKKLLLFYRRKKIGNVSRPHSFPRPLSAGGKSAEAKRKILFPRKKDFRFAESVLKPHHLLEELEAESRKKMFSSFFRRKN